MSTAKKWNSSIMFPTGSDYCNRIVGASFSPSKSSGNPMVTIECEVVSPQEVEVAGEQVTISAVKTTNYYPTTVFSDPTAGVVDEEKTAKSRGRLTELLDKVGYPAERNWDNFDTKPLLGKLILTQMEAEEEEKRKTPTSAQIEAAKKIGKRAEGDVMKNPITGKALINYWPKVREVFGLAPDQGGVAVPY